MLLKSKGKTTSMVKRLGSVSRARQALHRLHRGARLPAQPSQSEAIYIISARDSRKHSLNHPHAFKSHTSPVQSSCAFCPQDLPSPHPPSTASLGSPPSLSGVNACNYFGDRYHDPYFLFSSSCCLYCGSRLFFNIPEKGLCKQLLNLFN